MHDQATQPKIETNKMLIHARLFCLAPDWLHLLKQYLKNSLYIFGVHSFVNFTLEA